MSRAERLSGLLREEIASILQSKVNDTRIGFVSITEVDVTDDLSDAKIYVSCFGSEQEKRRSMRGLISAIPFIRGLIAKTIELRIVPNLRFIRDDSIEEGDRKLALINKLSQERTQREKSQSTSEDKVS